MSKHDMRTLVESPTTGNFKEIPINQFKMEQPAEICENYQLKWGSYTSYIHSCIANSIISEDSYADVALVTMDGHKIMAHRFVLSYASQYLSKALKFHPKVTTSLPIMIVLPQDITFKALKILVKYMYSGEATVSKDVLNSVLLAGDILKIKGLYREEEVNLQQQQRRSSTNSQKSTTPSTGNVVNSQTNTQLKLKQQILNKEKGAEPAVVPSVGSATKSVIATAASSSSKPNIVNPQVRKEASAQKVNVLNSKIVVASKSKEGTPSGNQGMQPIKVYQSRPKVLNFTMNNGGDKENLPQFKSKDKPHTITSANDTDTLESPGETVEHVTIKAEASKTGDGVQYLVIKDEPLEWGEAEMDISEQKMYISEEVKNEGYDSNSNASIDVDGKNEYSPLTCELCTETFTVPAEWVRHVQTHTDKLPAKRRRRDSPEEEENENATFPELECDLCKTVFSTPAEWVRHIQDEHTEFELSLSNKSNTTTAAKKIDTVRAKASLNDPRMCQVCLKMFKSRAAMWVHHRSHSGVLPYVCKCCQKGFNVKSNLIRHLRTIHNNIVNAYDLQIEEGAIKEEPEDNAEQEKSVEKPNKKFECDLCKILFSNSKEWAKHAKENHQTPK